MKKFTLVELLVVIAIIGILISMLLPSLLKAREKTKAAVCLSNYKQLAVLNFTFSTDNNGRAVGKGNYLCGTNGSVEYPQIFNWLYFDQESIVNRLGSFEDGQLSCVSATNISDVRRAMVYNVDLRGGYWWGGYSPTRYGVAISDQSLWPGSPYGSGSPYYQLGAPMSMVNNPADYLMFADANSANDVMDPRFSNAGSFASSLSYTEYGIEQRGVFAFRHSGKSTIAYSDGHVELKTPKYENFLRKKTYFEYQ